jgi:uncharacterized membrane protein YqhA
MTLLFSILRSVLVSGRYVVIIAIAGTFVSSVALMVYQGLIIAGALTRVVLEGTISAGAGKSLAVGLIQAIDVFLIAIVAYITSVGLYALFVDDALALPPWLQIHDLEELKRHLVSVIIAVLAVLFLGEAVTRAGELDLFRLGITLAIMIVALTFFITRGPTGEE